MTSTELALDVGDLVIGIVKPIGASTRPIEDAARKVVQAGAGRRFLRIGLMERFWKLDPIRGPQSKKDSFKYKQDAIRSGNEARRESGQQDFFALLAIAEIEAERKQAVGSAPLPPPERARPTGTFYFVNSIKRAEEVERLRAVFGNRFLLIGAYADRTTRVRNLALEMALAEGSTNSAPLLHCAEKLIADDNEEVEEVTGQRVGKAYPLADAFIDCSDLVQAEASTDRLLRLLLGYPFETPTLEEFGMMVAKTSSLRSSDLSRQVGAVILNRKGDIISTGFNDAARVRGGIQWLPNGSPNQSDSRDFHLGVDSSDEMKKALKKDILKHVRQELEKKSRNIEPKTIESVETALNVSLQKAEFNNVGEYGRAVHAELAAITDAARRGVRVQGMVLICTTFPCHTCAKHIVASGIKSVVFLESYPKSRVAELFAREISVDARVRGRIWFRPFVGVSPKLYRIVFEHDNRSRRDADTKKAKSWDPSTGELIQELQSPIGASPKLWAISQYVEILEEKLKIDLRQNSIE